MRGEDAALPHENRRPRWSRGYDAPHGHRDNPPDLIVCRAALAGERPCDCAISVHPSISKEGVRSTLSTNPKFTKTAGDKDHTNPWHTKRKRERRGEWGFAGELGKGYGG